MKSVSRKYYLDIIRVVALICIIYNHTGDRGNNAYLYTESRITFIASLLSDIICRVGVPLFLMITGALLLPKEESLYITYKKRGVRIVFAIIIFTIIRYLYEYLFGTKNKFSILEIFYAIICGDLFLPYWYLYTYLSIILLIPFLRKLVKGLTKKELNILIILIIGFYMFLPIISTLFNINFEISFMINLNCCYLFLGYYLEQLKIKNNLYIKKILITISVIALSTITSWIVWINRTEGMSIQQEYVGLLTPIIAICIFYFIMLLWEKKENTGLVGKIIVRLSSCSFGIYLIEDYLRNGLAFIFKILEPLISTLPACAVWLFCVLIAGGLIVTILKKMPILGDIL